MNHNSPWRPVAALLALTTLLALSGCARNATPPRPRANVPAPTSPTTVAATGATGTASTTAPPAPSATARAGIAALVNGEQIPLWEYHALLELNLENNGAGNAPSTTRTRGAVRARTIRQVVDEALLNAYAEQHGLAVGATTIAARLEAYRLQSGAGFAASLARLGVSETQFQRMIARNLNAQAVTQRVIGGIKAPAVRVQVLQIIVPSAARAREIRNSLLRGMDAALVAVEQSTDLNLRRLAGQLPPLTRADGDALYGPGWSLMAFSLRPGQISAPVRVRAGWAIMQVVERQPAAHLMQYALDSFINGLRHTARMTLYVH